MLSHFQWVIFSIILVFLILFSGFFSAAETGLMTINRYRLRHRAKEKKRIAILILRLLKHPDRLLGMLLIGNCLANILASGLATIMAISLLGDKGVIVSTLFVTLAVLVFAEVAPKTVAAFHPERVAYWVAWPMYLMLKIFYPVVWLINMLANGFLRLCRINVGAVRPDHLSREELRSVVHEAGGRLPHEYQEMLLGILDLHQVSVADVMVPHHHIVGIDLEWDWDLIRHKMAHCMHSWLPVYRNNINQLVGMLHLRQLMNDALSGRVITREVLAQMVQEAYFVPENTPLNIQLLNFQRESRVTALVVDEYGDIQGLLTVTDILEEIVGNITTDTTGTTRLVQRQKDGSYLVDGALAVREFNRLSGWILPARGPRTLSGLIIEHLEAIPRAGTSILIDQHPIEVVQVQENRVRVARLMPRLSSRAVE